MTETRRITVPAGEYWLGDPCYSFHGPRDKDWLPWLEAADYSNHVDNQNIVLHAKVPDTEFTVLGLSTAYGDGHYKGSDGEYYAVDAGLIGLVPVEYTNNVIPTYQNGSGDPICTRVTFTENTECWIEYVEIPGVNIWSRYKKWILHFGLITIDTLGEEDDE
jgi:hypothetical protein